MPAMSSSSPEGEGSVAKRTKRSRMAWLGGPLLGHHARDMVLQGNDDLLAEILLRLPPRLSALACAAAVSNRWRAVLSDAYFRRRFRELHPKPPLLGFFHNVGLGASHRFVACGEAGGGGDGGGAAVPAARFSMPCLDPNGWVFLDCRGGLALLVNHGISEAMVWNPLVGTRRRFPFPPDLQAECLGAVVRGPGGAGDGGDREYISFRVVLMWLMPTQPTTMLAAVYSSDSAKWGDVFADGLDSWFDYPLDASLGDWSKPGCLVGDSIYWLLPGCCIVEFDTASESLALIDLPGDAIHPYWLSQLVRTQDGGLGFILMLGESLQFWKRGDSVDGVATWEAHRTVELDSFLPAEQMQMQSVELPTLLGFDEVSYAIFIWTDVGVFMVQLESMQSKIICQGLGMLGIFPYTSFCYHDDIGKQPVKVGPIARAFPKAAMEAINMWHYLDPQGIYQGPFSISMIRKWQENGFFPEGFKVWRTDQTKEQAILITDLCG